MIVDSIFKALASLLSIVDEKLRTKYQDKIIDLRNRWYEEDKKPAGSRNDAYIDSLKFELRNIVDSFTSEIKPKNP